MATITSTSFDVIELLNHEPARQFVKMNIRHSYEEAILMHHPKAQQISLSKLQHALKEFIDDLFHRLPSSIPSLESLSGLVQEFKEKRKAIPYFEEAYQHYRATQKQKNRYSYLSPHFVGRKWVDIGCSSAEFLNYIQIHHRSEFDALLGVEIGPFQKSSGLFDFLICDLKEEKPRIEQAYDTGFLLSVLHHVSDDVRVILNFLSNLNAFGIKRLLLEEDVLIEPNDLHLAEIKDAPVLREKQFKLQQYMRLDMDTQMGVTSLADFLSNSLFGSHQMPFPFSFKSCSEWKVLFEESGWTLKKIDLRGFQKGNFNQVCHALFVLDRNY